MYNKNDNLTETEYTAEEIAPYKEGSVQFCRNIKSRLRN